MSQTVSSANRRDGSRALLGHKWRPAGRDGRLGPGLYLDAGIILTSFVLLLFVREPRVEQAEPAPAHSEPELG
jgi:hypothetical protein